MHTPKTRIWRSIQTKILASFMLAILLPFAMLGVVSYRNYIDTINTNLITHNETMGQLFSERINDFFRQLDHLYFSLHSSNMLQTVGRIENRDFDSVRYVLEMNRTVDSLVAFYGLTGIVDSVLIVKEDGTIIYQSGRLTPQCNNVAVANLIDEGRFGEVAGVSLPYYADAAIPSPSGPHIAYFRRTGAATGLQQRLFVVFEVRMARIWQMLEQLREMASHTIVLAENDMLILQVGDIQISYQMLFDSQDSGHPRSYDVGGRQVLVASHPIHGTSWTFLSIIDEAALFRDAARLRNFTILLTIAAFVFASVTSLIVSFGIVTPIKKIKAISQRIMAGEMDIQIPVVSKDEIGELGQCMDNMLQNTRSLLTEKYTIEIRQKEAQLYALQVQINPHFLYNTMEAIRAMATIAGVKNISDVAMDMVDMFRYSLKSISTPAKLRDEINHVSHYLNILKTRHEERLHYEFDIEEAALECPVERLLLQPLVENAVKHGIEPKRRGGLIRITAKRIDDKLALTVEDEGIGMDKDTLNKLRQSLVQMQEYQDEHIGLSNIYGRLYLSYGDAFSFDIESVYGEGTRVKIMIPLFNGNTLVQEG